MKNIKEIINSQNTRSIIVGKDRVKIADIIARFPEGVNLTAWESRTNKEGETSMVCTYAEEPENYFYAPRSLLTALVSVELMFNDHDTAVDEFNASGTVVKMHYKDIGDGRRYIVTEAI